MITLFFLLLGLIIGSFLNVVVCRLKENETVLGRSICRSCHRQIRWYDNIPLLSFLLLGGKCRDCQAPISAQYPLLEALTGLGFATVGSIFFDITRPETWVQTGWLLGLVALFLALSAYDLQYMEIPVLLLVLSALWTGLFLVIISYQSGSVPNWGWHTPLVQGLYGGGIVALFFFALVYFSKETWMGWGDVWLGGIAGMIVGIQASLFMLTLSFGIGAVCGISMMVLGKKGMKSQIPFAPYLVAGTLLTVFLSRVFPQYISWFLL
ncbi:MAG: prepilin peptidase [Candidatus Moranbacteria bacterium]|nr:prepilin peptidase [Candidatus Moranbacteria bacterium]